MSQYGGYGPYDPGQQYGAQGGYGGQPYQAQYGGQHDYGQYSQYGQYGQYAAGQPLYGPGYATYGPPGSVTAARVIMFIQAGLSSLGLVLGVIGLVAILAIANEMDSSSGRVSTTSATPGVLVGVLALSAVVGLVTVVFLFLLAVKFPRRTNAVRVGSLVLESVMCVFGLIGLFFNITHAGFTGVLTLFTSIGPAIAVVILLATPGARAYFTN